ncbi:unnamed protein product [Caenorhabditis brenneri]
MPELLKNDDKSIRSYILNDVLEKVPIDKSYKNLCKVIGNDAIAFYDFQFCSEPEPLQFSDLPVDAVGLIVDKLEMVERLILRRVSKPLREFIEKQGFDCTSITIVCGDDLIRVSYGDGQILHAKNDEAVMFYEDRYPIREALILYGDHYDSEAFNDLAWILKNPKLQIYSFEFSHMVPCHKDGGVSKFFNKFELVLKSLKHQISVRWLELRPEHPDNVLAILPYLKPGYLEKITIVMKEEETTGKNLPLKMADSLKNDDKSIRSCILNDVLEKVPIDKSYENLCKVIGNDAIAFYDFQFWYYRFLSGKQDLDFDRSSEPESLKFSDLPVDAVRLIVDELNVLERLMLRKVSKPLREFIEKQVFDCTCINVSCGHDLISIRYDEGRIFYAKNYSLFIYGNHFESEASNDLACVLKNPKLQLCYFEISPMVSGYEDEVFSTFFTKLENALKSLKHQIAVKELYLGHDQPDDVLAILPYLKPGYLQKITFEEGIGSFDWKSDENIRKDDNFMDSIGVPGPPTENYRSIRHYMIPNTDKMLVFKEFLLGGIEIEKKTRDVQ